MFYEERKVVNEKTCVTYLLLNCLVLNGKPRKTYSKCSNILIFVHEIDR